MASRKRRTTIILTSFMVLLVSCAFLQEKAVLSQGEKLSDIFYSWILEQTEEADEPRLEQLDGYLNTFHFHYQNWLRAASKEEYRGPEFVELAVYIIQVAEFEPSFKQRIKRLSIYRTFQELLSSLSYNNNQDDSNDYIENTRNSSSSS